MISHCIFEVFIFARYLDKIEVLTINIKKSFMFASLYIYNPTRGGAKRCFSFCFVSFFVLFCRFVLVLVVVLVAFFLVVAVVALPLLLLPTGKPPKPPPGPPKPTNSKQKTKQNIRKSLFSLDPAV